MRIAVVGAGISGMVVAYLLHEDHDVVLFEASDYPGGHTHTVDTEIDGKVFSVDTGFIVFNEETYPNFVRLLKRIDVPWQRSQMSFSVKCEKTGLEYSPSSINSLFAQRSNIFRPSFYRMILDIFRFRRESIQLLKSKDYSETLGAYLAGKGYSKTFIEQFIVPMGAAVWSAGPEKFRQFPARYFIEFFHNHGFLRVSGQPQWLVVQGGSRRYVERLTEPYKDHVRLKCPVESIRRNTDHVAVKPKGAEAERYDCVVIATHSDQALAMLSDPTTAEKEILSAIPYQQNRTILHTDANLLPRHKSCWASWNYHIPSETIDRVTVTYDMNILQGLSAPEEFCVTLNRPHVIDPLKVLKDIMYHHPVYTPNGLMMRERRGEINGINRTYYCGAYWGYGFHEDGVKSALAVCKHFGKTL